MNGSIGHKGRWPGIVGGWLLVLLALAWPPKLWAHTDLIAAEPAPGALLPTSPTEIRLTFGEPNDPLSRIVLFAPGFQAVSGVITSVDPAVPEQLIAQLPPLTPNTYTVQWVAVSIDKHMVRGSYMFSVQPATNRDRWLSVTATLAIGILLLVCGPWCKKMWQRREQQVSA